MATATKTKKATKSVKAPKPKPTAAPPVDVPKICHELQDLQRNRATLMKSRIMIENRLTAVIATMMGYSAKLEEDDRERIYKAAKDMIAPFLFVEEEMKKEEEKAKKNGRDVVPIDESKLPDDLRYASIIRSVGMSIATLRYEQKRTVEPAMVKLVRQLPVYAWSQRPEQKGFGELSLAIIIGETGDLSQYTNPAKVWRRMSCAPFSSKGVTAMGSTWRRKGGLTAEQWTEFGYSPRRRSIMHIIEDVLVKANKSVYRQRYDDVKARSMEGRLDWSACPGTMRTKKTGEEVKTPCRGAKCGKCKGTGKVPGRCHNHAMLLTGKLLLKNLWLEWNNHPPRLPGSWQPDNE